jgi:hypothetical protein
LRSMGKRHLDEIEITKNQTSGLLKSEMEKASRLVLENSNLLKRIGKMKQKFRARVNMVTESYDQKVTAALGGYKSKISGLEAAKTDLEKINFELKFETQKLFEEAQENKILIKNLTESIDQTMKAQGEANRENQDRNFATIEMKDVHIKNMTQEKFSQIKKIDELEFELKKFQDSFVEIEKENQILIEEILFLQTKKILEKNGQKGGDA